MFYHRYRRVKQKKLNLSKIISLSIIFKIVGIGLVMIFLPIFKIESSFSSQSPLNVSLQLNTQKPYPVVSSESVVKIVLGESNFDQEKRKNLRFTRAYRTVLPRERIDPTLEVKRALVKQAAEKFNIDWKILEAVWQVESGKSWDTSRRSRKGATGPMQFLPSTFKRYAQDGDSDGQISITDASDSLFSAANLLATLGASQGDIRKALLSYNHADWYVRKVLRVADSIKE